MGSKTSFQIYFDNLPGVEQLSREQRGDLFLALMHCALRAAEEPGLTAQRFLEEMKQPLDPLTGVVFLFMASSICRDTQKWRQQVERDQRRREEKKKSSGKKKKVPAPPPEPEQSPLIKLPGYPAEPVNVLEKGQSWEDYRQEQLRELGRVNPRLLREDDGRWR